MFGVLATEGLEESPRKFRVDRERRYHRRLLIQLHLLVHPFVLSEETRGAYINVLSAVISECSSLRELDTEVV